MEYTLGSLLVGALGAGVGLYLLWKLIDRLDHLAIQRRAKARQLAGEDSICRWGFNSAGELMHVRCRRTPKQD